ncbi:hypothetical protein RDI58_013194 [Solanum bulbocastanum]|uniref:Uncharacterized protein n=1 Tax=Solanum bulbocastanum TaxID=147425 RepID=A0AAN8TKD5_SOLBU
MKNQQTEKENDPCLNYRN